MNFASKKDKQLKVDGFADGFKYWDYFEFLLKFVSEDFEFLKLGKKFEEDENFQKIARRFDKTGGDISIGIRNLHVIGIECNNDKKKYILSMDYYLKSLSYYLFKKMFDPTLNEFYQEIFIYFPYTNFDKYGNILEERIEELNEDYLSKTELSCKRLYWFYKYLKILKEFVISAKLNLLYTTNTITGRMISNTFARTYYLGKWETELNQNQKQVLLSKRTDYESQEFFSPYYRFVDKLKDMPYFKTSYTNSISDDKSSRKTWMTTQRADLEKTKEMNNKTNNWITHDLETKKQKINLAINIKEYYPINFQEYFWNLFVPIINPGIDTNKQMQNISEFKSILFQIIWGLYVAYENFGFRHNDLHYNNIRLEKVKEENENLYYFDKYGKIYFKVPYKYKVKIIDFDRSYINKPNEHNFRKTKKFEEWNSLERIFNNINKFYYDVNGGPYLFDVNKPLPPNRDLELFIFGVEDRERTGLLYIIKKVICSMGFNMFSTDELSKNEKKFIEEEKEPRKSIPTKTTINDFYSLINSLYGTFKTNLSSFTGNLNNNENIFNLIKNQKRLFNKNFYSNLLFNNYFNEFVTKFNPPKDAKYQMQIHILKDNEIKNNHLLNLKCPEFIFGDLPRHIKDELKSFEKTKPKIEPEVKIPERKNEEFFQKIIVSSGDEDKIIDDSLFDVFSQEELFNVVPKNLPPPEDPVIHNDVFDPIPKKKDPCQSPKSKYIIFRGLLPSPECSTPYVIKDVVKIEEDVTMKEKKTEEDVIMKEKKISTTFKNNLNFSSW